MTIKQIESQEQKLETYFFECPCGCGEITIFKGYRLNDRPLTLAEAQALANSRVH